VGHGGPVADGGGLENGVLSGVPEQLFQRLRAIEKAGWRFREYCEVFFTHRRDYVAFIVHRGGEIQFSLLKLAFSALLIGQEKADVRRSLVIHDFDSGRFQGVSEISDCEGRRIVRLLRTRDEHAQIANRNCPGCSAFPDRRHELQIRA